MAYKIDPGKSSFEYEPREVLVENLIDESAHLRSEVFSARVDLRKRALLGRAIDQERLQRLQGKYKGLEQDIIELADCGWRTSLTRYARNYEDFALVVMQVLLFPLRI